MIELPRRAKKTKETPIVTAIETALNRIPGVWAFRNNVGALEDPHGRWVTFGLGTGSPDVVGYITIDGPDGPAAGLPCGFGLEVKTPHARNAHPEIQAGQEAWRGLARDRSVGAARSSRQPRQIVVAQGRIAGRQGQTGFVQPQAQPISPNHCWAQRLPWHRSQTHWP